MRDSSTVVMVDRDMETQSKEGSLCPICGGVGRLLVTVSSHEHYLCRSCGGCYRVTIAQLPFGTVEICDSATPRLTPPRLATTALPPRRLRAHEPRSPSAERRPSRLARTSPAPASKPSALERRSDLVDEENPDEHRRRAPGARERIVLLSSTLLHDPST